MAGLALPPGTQQAIAWVQLGQQEIRVARGRLKPGQEVLVAESADAFAETVLALLDDPQRQRLYSRAWRRLRKTWLAEHPWCEECLKQGFYVQAEQVHHTKPHRGDVDVFWECPLESLCASCHSRKTAGEVRRRGLPESVKAT